MQLRKKKKERKERSRKDELKITEHLINGFYVFVSFLYTLLLLQICSRYKRLEILYPILTDHESFNRKWNFPIY